MKFYFSRFALFAFLLFSQPIFCDTELEPIKGKIFRPGSIENFEMMLQRYDIILADFFADWCGPCKNMHKVIESLAQDRDLDEILFIEVDTDSHRALALSYHVSSLPTLIIFVDGKPLKILHGYKDKRALKQILMEVIRDLRNE